MDDRRNANAPQSPHLAQAAADLIADDSAAQLAETFKALGDPTRLRLISVLAGRALCVGDLADLLSMSLSAVSHQLTLLWRLHLVRRRREGRRIYYALDDEHVVSLYQAARSHIEHV